MMMVVKMMMMMMDTIMMMMIDDNDTEQDYMVERAMDGSSTFLKLCARLKTMMRISEVRLS